MFFHLHAHSNYSTLDALPSVEDMVDKVVGLNQPALALTDHGNMSGAVQLYKACSRKNILPFIGEEFYLVSDVTNKDAPRHHILVHALNFDGYKELVKLSSTSHLRENFHYKPRIDYNLLSQIDTSNLVATTGCYFGPVIQALINKGPKQAAKEVLKLKKLFPNLFIEIQHHNNDPDGEIGETEIAIALYSIANELGIPIIITNDAHYCKKTEKPIHDFMKSIAYKAVDPGDVTFPGDSYHLASDTWVASHYMGDLWPIWQDSQDSYTWLLENHSLRIPTLDKYKYFIPQVVNDANQALRKWTNKWLKGKSEEYKDRIEYELEIIEELGMADYFVLVKKDITDYCRKQGILFNTRGSANGSLVCFAIGITDIDSIVWNLSFDRFLSLDRTVPPDIDLDIEDARRHEVVEHLASKYEICQIGTYGRMGYNEDGTGGVFVQYLAAERKRLGKENFKEVWGSPKGLHDIRNKNHVVAELLTELGDLDVLKSAGAHAAGFVISTKDHSLHDLVPKMLTGSDTTVTQYLMDDVEAFGFVKIDKLGSRALTTIRMTLEYLEREISLDWIPLDDVRTFAFLRQGRKNTGIFQFEGYAQADGCNQIKVRELEDLVVVNALFRPAITNNGYDQVYKGRMLGIEEVDYIDESFEEILEPTYGIPIFQEQVMEMLRVVGFDIKDLNSMLKAIKASNDKVAGAEETFQRLQDQFYYNCNTIGLTNYATNHAWQVIRDFSSYAFNRAHSVSYALIGYYMAYLKVHYPLEFHAALLSSTLGTPKEKAYEAETRRFGIRILSPDINISDTTWTIDRDENAIRRGLASIKGIGLKATEQIVSNRPFTSVDDLIERTDSRAITGGKNWEKDRELNGTLLALKKTGALNSIGMTRYN